QRRLGDERRRPQLLAQLRFRHDARPVFDEQAQQIERLRRQMTFGGALVELAGFGVEDELVELYLHRAWDARDLTRRYPSRSTIIGSTRPAARAGRYDATTATISTATAVPMKTDASVGFTSFSIVCSSPVSSHEPTAPSATPLIASASPPPTRRFLTRASSAPSARRMPNSRRCRRTLYAITPYT